MYRALVVLLAFLFLYLLGVWWRGRREQREKQVEPPKLKPPRKLRPRTPKDCTECRREADQGTKEEREVIPWREVKSRRGRKKRMNTEGYACPNKECDYHGITDATVHALVGYGSHGKRERIQDLYRQACEKKFTVRRGTALYRLKTSERRVGEVLAAQAACPRAPGSGWQI